MLPDQQRAINALTRAPNDLSNDLPHVPVAEKRILQVFFYQSRTQS